MYSEDPDGNDRFGSDRENLDGDYNVEEYPEDIEDDEYTMALSPRELNVELDELNNSSGRLRIEFGNGDDNIVCP